MKKNLLYRIATVWCAIVFFSLNISAQATNGKLLMQQYLQQKNPGISTQLLESINVTRDYVDVTTGVRHIYANQLLNGLTINESVYGLHIKDGVTFDANNLVNFTSLAVNPVTATITPDAAILAVMNNINYADSKVFTLKSPASGTDLKTVFSRNASNIWDIPARLVYYHNVKSKALVPAWEVQMMDTYKNYYWQAFVNANTGVVLSKQDLITHCSFGTPFETDEDGLAHQHQENLLPTSLNKTWLAPVQAKEAQKNFAGIVNRYKVVDFPAESPQDTVGTNPTQGRHVFVNTGGFADASFDGWHRVGNATTYQYTRGNNVWAFQDPSPGPLGGVPSADPSRTTYNNGGALGAPSPTEPFLFDYSINLANQPETYQNAAIVNLFYWNNLVHDVYYNFGFNEVGGNFQNSHVFSTGLKGGAMDNAGDDVLAQAQDGGGTNNANMLTLQDGVNGQMQMYLWTGSLPDSLVEILSSTTGIPANNTRFFAVQGSFAGPVKPDLFTAPVANKEMVLVEKNMLSTVGTSSEGCTAMQMSVALPPNNNVMDKIVLIDRGGCSFVEKVLGAQNGGAAGVIIINNAPGEPIAVGGADAPGNAITIPAVMVSQAVGTLLKAQLGAGKVLRGSLKRTKPSAPKRDGSLDNGVIAHEYGHGISTRLTGGPDGGALGGSEQGGEGWSDFTALYMTLRTDDLSAPTTEHPNGVLQNRAIGNYVTYQNQNGRGIRPAPYSINMAVNPLTLKDIKNPVNTVPHGVGSIWCTMLYEMLQVMIDKYGFNNDMYNSAVPTTGPNPSVPTVGADKPGGNNVAMRLIIEGMKLQESSPTFVQMRNAILKADTMLYSGENVCEIWKAFAKRGLGFSAVSGSNAVGDEVEAFDLPLSCNATQKSLNISITGPIILQNGNTIPYKIVVKNKASQPALGVKLRDTLPANMSFVSSVVTPVDVTPTVDGRIVEWSFDLAANETKTFNLTARINSQETGINLFNDNHEDGTGGWTTNTTVLGPWQIRTDSTASRSGRNHWFTENIAEGGQESILTTASGVAATNKSHLVFFHRYATEANFDGGVVETSINNGTTWTYLPGAKFIRNSYNGVIPTANTPQIGPSALAAFSGSSQGSGYITSIAKLDNLSGSNVRFRFRMVSDVPGTAVEGWSMDDVLVLDSIVERTNTATVIGSDGEPINESQGANARNSTSGFVVGAFVLPLGLGNLEARVGNNNAVALNWSNENDINANRYYVERKASNEATFTTLGEVSPKNKSGNQKFTFNDATANKGGQYNYRIRLENNDGQTLFTNVAFIRLNAKDFTVNIFPNPTKDVANISISNPGGGTVTFRVYDMMGKNMGTFNAGSGTNLNVPLPVNGFAAGTYFVEIMSGDNTAITRMVVTK